MKLTAMARYALAIALLVGPGFILAQEDKTDNKPASASIGGFFSNIGKGLGAAFGAAPDKPLLATLTPGAYTPSNEAIGEDRDIESKRVEHLGLVPLPAYLNPANAIYQRLKEASGITGLPGSVFLLASSELKASSSPDGNVFLSIGWVRSIESEDELAALLAHELSHVLLHHHDSTVISRAQKQVQFLFAGAAVLKNQLDKVSQAGSGTLTAEQNKSLQYMQLLIELTDQVALPAWTRGQELDADRLAADLLRRTGYSIKGLTDFMEHVAAWDAEQEAARKKVDEQIQLNMQTLVSQGKVDAAMKDGLQNAFGRFREIVSAQHDSADKRREELSAYLDKHHADMPRVAIRREAYQGLLAQRQVKPVIEAYGQTFEAMTQLRDGRSEEAIRLLNTLTRPGSPVANDALPNYQLYVALRERGRSVEALKHLERSFVATEPSWKPFEAAMRVMVVQGKRDRALQIAEDARRRFKDAPALTPQLVGIYTELGFKEQAQQALTTCNLNHVVYREACQARGKTL